MFQKKCILLVVLTFCRNKMYLSLRYGLEEFLLEFTAHNDGQHEAVEQVVAVDVGKGTAYHHTHAITGDSPCCMLAAGARTPVLSAYDDFVHALLGCLAILGFVHHEVCHGVALGIKAEVVHEGIAEELRVARCACQIAGRDYKVCIAVVNLNRKAG